MTRGERGDVDDAGGGRNLALGYLRLAATYALVAALAFISRPTPVVVAVGAVFVALGETFRVWAAGHLLKSRELAVSGPYRHTQNPLYFGRLCILTGFCIMAWLPPGWNLAVLAAGWVIFFAYYLPRKVRVEGERLRRLHGGQWESYFKSVPILFPRPSPYGTNVRAWDTSRFLRNREHWMLTGVTVVTLIFLMRSLLPRSLSE